MPRTRRPDRRLVFPVGHLVGSLGSPSGQVRLGRDMTTLDEAALRTWALAQGDPSRVGLTSWTVADLVDSATQAQVDGAATQVDQLLSTGALVAVTPGTVEASEFARAYRLVPLMNGLATPAPEPDRYGLGATYRSFPSAVVNEDLYAVWRFAPLTSSLLDLAEQFSAQAIESGIDASEASTDVVLRDVLEMLHVLLSQAAGYLDLARR